MVRTRVSRDQRGRLRLAAVGAAIRVVDVSTVAIIGMVGACAVAGGVAGGEVI